MPPRKGIRSLVLRATAIVADRGDDADVGFDVFCQFETRYWTEGEEKGWGID